MKDHIHKFVQKCPYCQAYKKTGVKKYGKLPIKDNISLAPFDTVSVDLIGPWNIKIQQEKGRMNHTKKIKFKALKICNVGSTLTEIEPYFQGIRRDRYNF